MIRQMTEADIEEVLPYVRAQEARTIQRLGLDPRATLRRALGPYAFSAINNDGRVASLWGVAFTSNVGVLPRLWLVTTPLIEGQRVRFLRESLRFVQWASANFGPLEGCVDQTNEVSKRWLEWLGFRAVEDLPQGYVRMHHGY